MYGFVAPGGAVGVGGVYGASGRTGGGGYGYMNSYANGWTGGWTKRRMDGWVDRFTHVIPAISGQSNVNSPLIQGTCT